MISLSTLFLITIVCFKQLKAVQSQPCQFCTRGEIGTPEKPVSIPGYESIDSCGAIDSILPLISMEGSPECDFAQSLSSVCGCPKPRDSCSFCPDESSVPSPNRQVAWLSEQFGGFVPTCEMVEASVASLSETDDTCSHLQLISSYCGCPPVPNHCKFCNGEPLKEEFYNKELPFLRSEYLGTTDIGFTPTCEVFYASQYQLENDANLCSESHYAVIQCGCNDGHLFYHGTADPAKHAVLAWLPRAVGMLSLCASILVLVDIIRDPEKRRASIYHQLVGSAAVFDMITSIVWIVGPAAINPFDEVTGLDAGIYGAGGSVSTCRVQSFFFQLGCTSVFLNVSLTAYFMLLVVSGYRERQLRRKKLLLFGAPIVVGVALSFAVIPFASRAYTHCQFDSTTPWVVVVFGFVPVLGSSFAILVMLFIIYCSVRRRFRSQRSFDDTVAGSSLDRESQQMYSEYQRTKNREAARKRSLEQTVFRQCVAYAAAFGITWPILGVALVKGSDHDLPYGFWVFVAATVALQGFNNAVCYFRLLKSPCAAFRCRSKHRCCCCCRHKTRNRDRPTSLSPASLNRLCRGSVEPRSLWVSSTVSRQGHPPEQVYQQLDPAVELENLGTDEAEGAAVISLGNSNICGISAESSGSECAHTSNHNVVLAGCERRIADSPQYCGDGLKLDTELISLGEIDLKVVEDAPIEL